MSGEKKESGLSKILKNKLKRETSQTALKSQTVVFPPGPTSISYLQSPHGGMLPTASSSPSLGHHISSGSLQSSSSLPSSSNSTPSLTPTINRSTSNLSVKFMDTIEVNEHNANEPASSPNRPRTSTLKAEKKERFSFLTRSLRKSKINILDENANTTSTNQQQPQSEGSDVNIPSIHITEDGLHTTSLRDSSSSIASINSVSSMTSVTSAASEKKSRRNSIFVRLLNRKSRDISHMTEEDFEREHSIHHQGNHHLLPTSSSASDLGQSRRLPQQVERSSSSINISTTISPPPPPMMNMIAGTYEPSRDQETNELREQLSEATSELTHLRVKESEWRREREDLIRKIQLLSNSTPQSSSPSLSNSRNDHYHHHHQLHGSEHGELHHSSSLPHIDSAPSSPSLSKSPSIQSMSMEVSSSAPLSHSSSSISFSASAFSSSPNSSPPLPRRNNRNRYTLAIPKWDDSMNFNGNPFERLVEALKNSCEIFPPNDTSSSMAGSPNSMANLLLINPNNIGHRSNTLLSSSPSSTSSSSGILPINSSNNTNNNNNNNNSNNNNNNNKQTTTTTTTTTTITTTTTTLTPPLDEQAQKKHILSICLKKMLDKLIAETNESSAVFKTFFSTYECIYDSHDVLDTLINQYKNESPQSQMRICTILKSWLQNYYIPALSDIVFINKVKDFLIETKNTDRSYNFDEISIITSQISGLLVSKIQERGGISMYNRGITEADKTFVTKKSKQKIRAYLSTSLKTLVGYTDMIEEDDMDNQPSPPPSPTQTKHDRVNQLIRSPSGHLSSASIDHNSSIHDSDHLPQFVETRPRSSTWSTSDIFLSIMDAPAKEIAKSLTVVDYSIFICIEPTELMNGVWGKPHLKDKALNISKLISRFNEISMNVIQTILNEEKLKDRCKVMAKFIKIAKNLHELRNYNSMMAIYAGVSHSAVVRLKWTKKILPKVNQKTLQDLEKLMESDENFKNYRNELKTISTPCIPFLGLILSDMTFISEGNPDFIGTDDGNWTLNIAKLKMVYNTLKQIQLFQKNHYLLNADPRLLLLLTPGINIFGESINPVPFLTQQNQHQQQQQQNKQITTKEKEKEKEVKEKEMIKKSFIPQIPVPPKEEETAAEETKKIQEQNNRLFRSFTLDGETMTKKKQYSYNSATWSPKKSLVKNALLTRLKVERSQSETNLPTIKNIMEAQTHQLLDSIIRGDFSNPNSPRNNFSPTKPSSSLSSQDAEFNNVQQQHPLKSPSIPIIKSIGNSQLNRTNSSKSESSSPAFISPSTSMSNLPSIVVVDEQRDVTSSSKPDDLSSSFNGSSSSSGQIGSTASIVDDGFKSLPRKGGARRKSVSTNNIFSILTPNKDQGHYYLSPKSHNRSSSVAGGQHSLPSTPPTGTSGQVSPGVSTPAPHQPSTHHQSIANSTSHSFSIFSKRKSLSVVSERPPHFFTPMSDEGLFSLSLKLEPRGVKYQDLV